MKKRYDVTWWEATSVKYYATVIAETENEAIEKARNGEVEHDNYSSTYCDESWSPDDFEAEESLNQQNIGPKQENNNNG